MPHADTPHPVADDAHAATSDEHNPAIKDAAVTLWIVIGAIAVWSAVVSLFVL